MEEVYTFLNNNLKDDEYVVIGVSGGVDSMVLLSLLNKKISNKIVCVHIHHNLRKESDEELDFVRNYCKINNLIFEFTKFKYDKKFSEEIAREKRYSFFEEIIKKYNSKVLLTAHHGDDLVETILMRLVRGSTIKGYSGIELVSKRENYNILRPLLYLTKEDIYKYAEKYSIPYREDKTNDIDDYTRNRYRKYILPFLKEENNNVHLKFIDYSSELLDYYYYIDSVVNIQYQKVVSENIINLNLFKELDSFLKKVILKKYLFSIFDKDIDKITSSHVSILLDFIDNGKTNSNLDLPNNYKAIKEYSSLKITLSEVVESYNLNFDKKIILPNGKTVSEVDETGDTSNYVTYLDSSMVELPFTIRTYEPGDKIAIKNMDGHKKISDIFTDEKINIEDRYLWPILVDNSGEIIWIPGLKKSHFDRKKDEKYDIILRYY